MRARYAKEMEELNLELIRIGAMAEKAIGNAMRVVFDGDIDLAKSVIEEDDEVDKMTRRIEGISLRLMAQSRLAEDDMRIVSTALKMVTDIERICDHAADIAEITLTLSGKQACEKPLHFTQMWEVAGEMVRLAVDSYVKLDTTAADRIVAMDDTQDELFSTVKHELVGLMIDDRGRIDSAVDMIQIAKYLERISDHAENIAEWTMFAVTGIHNKERIF